MKLPDLSERQRIVLFTGAGMSAESGVPTYRGRGGIWHEYNYEDYACQDAFERDPEKVWDFHDKRRAMTGAAAPHRGHALIAALERARPDTWVITQNIDGLHQRAGSEHVLELHGSLWRVRCDRCGVVEENRETPLSERRCSCGAYLRPDIVWFGDMLRVDTVREAIRRASECDVFISVGTSAVVFPAAEMPLYAKQHGATLIEVNLEDTPLSDAYDVRPRGSASEILEGLLGPLLSA